jgi:hypothetical protein
MTRGMGRGGSRARYGHKAIRLLALGSIAAGTENPNAGSLKGVAERGRFLWRFSYYNTCASGIALTFTIVYAFTSEMYLFFSSPNRRTGSALLISASPRSDLPAPLPFKPHA